MLLSDLYAASTQSGTVVLTVQTNDAAAEIFIIDSQFHRVAKNVGTNVSFALPRGLYTVKVCTGTEYEEKPVILVKDDTIEFAPIKFNSPAPLWDTVQTHETHVLNAQNHSHSIDETLGNGSQLYVFARDWTSAQKPKELPVYQHPARGLTLKDVSGRQLVDFAATKYPHSTDWDPWAACTLQLDPGAYRLCLETAAGDVLEQTIITSPDWQTQIFLLQRNYEKNEVDRRADLPNAGIFLAPLNQGFSVVSNGNSLDFRLTELARQALVNGRQVITDSIINQLLSGKFRNPMLGIYGASILLLAKKPNVKTLKIVIANLRNSLHMPHPDVEALALQLGEADAYAFTVPPMLRQSWSAILKASVQRPEFVPTDSLTSQVAGRLWSNGIWFLWTQPSPENNQDAILRSQLKKILQINSAADSTSLYSENVAGFTTVEFSPQTSDKSLDIQPDLPADRMPMNLTLDDKQIANLVQTLGVPRGKLNELLKPF